jgi:hypothetical protein
MPIALLLRAVPLFAWLLRALNDSGKVDAWLRQRAALRCALDCDARTVVAAFSAPDCTDDRSIVAEATKLWQVSLSFLRHHYNPIFIVRF